MTDPASGNPGFSDACRENVEIRQIGNVNNVLFLRHRPWRAEGRGSATRIQHDN